MEHLNQLIRTVLANDKDSEGFTKAVASLATLSREEEEARTRLAEEEVLERLMKVVKKQPRTLSATDLIAATLRCVGNACISNPTACARVVNFGFAWCDAYLISKSMSEHLVYRHSHAVDPKKEFPLWDAPPDEIRDLTVKVLYNICSQSEGAQKRCYRDGVDMLIAKMIMEQAPATVWTGPYRTAPMTPINLAVDLLFWITSHHKELAMETQCKRTHSADHRTVLGPLEMQSMLRLPEILKDSLDVEDWATLLESLLVFLRDPAAPMQLETELFEIWRILTFNESKIQAAQGDADDFKLLTALSTSLTWVLSDTAAVTDFDTPDAVAFFDENAAFIGDLVQLLCTGVAPTKATYSDHVFDRIEMDKPEVIDSDALRLTNAACQILGNLLHSLSTVKSDQPLVFQDRNIYQRIFALMTTSDNADFLHSAAGFLIQLSRPSPEVRTEIASDRNALPAIKRLGEHMMQQLNQDALMLMRALGKDTPAVQERLKSLAGEVMATVAETQQAAAAGGQTEQPLLSGTI